MYILMFCREKSAAIYLDFLFCVITIALLSVCSREIYLMYIHI